jgi:aryl-alcohol dehydrogenase-like predicted oxidoreductase
LNDLVRSGEVRYIGCSNLMAWQIMKAFGTSAREGLARFEIVQMASRDLEREIIPRYGHHAFRIRVMALSS